MKAAPQANDDFIDFNRKPNHTIVIFYYSSNISIFFQKKVREIHKNKYTDHVHCTDVHSIMKEKV